MVPMVTKARIVDKVGTSRRLASGLSGPILDDDDGDVEKVSSGVFLLLREV